jgi:hypothetical protein
MPPSQVPRSQVHRGKRLGRREDRDAGFHGEPFEAAGVVVVLVRQEDRAQLLRGKAHGFEPQGQLARRQAGIDEQAPRAEFDERRVPG